MQLITGFGLGMHQYTLNKDGQYASSSGSACGGLLQ